MCSSSLCFNTLAYFSFVTFIVIDHYELLGAELTRKAIHVVVDRYSLINVVCAGEHISVALGFADTR